ncbi:MAG: molybdopterin cofactor-binding domain-containing protein, partial [Woeseiaceae bacterium]|nr:molybdopterin cofactor-binding domain-containing protein [Woeseiaceae bacterium]
MKIHDRLARDPNIGAALRAAEDEPAVAWSKLDRRSFLKLTGLAGAGLTLAACTDAPSTDVVSAGAGSSFEPNAFINVGTDGIVTIVSKAPEIGQGIKTAFPMIVAEELDANWDDVRVEQARIDPETFGRQSAGGSRSIPSAWDQLRTAGASARAMLVAAAAARLGVPATELVTRDGTVSHEASGRTLGYGELAAAAAELPVPDPASLRFKPRAEYRLLGRRITGVDNEALVRGAPLFGIDQVVPGMHYASYTKCPATGGRVATANLDEIRALPGIVDAFVLEGNDTVSELMPGVAIVGESTWATQQARKALVVEWDERDASDDSSSALAAEAEHLAAGPGAAVLHETGDVESAFAGAAQTITAFYAYPFVSHAPLEPQNCTAHVTGDRVEIWAPTQTPDRALPSVARVLGIPEDNVLIHQTRVG